MSKFKVTGDLLVFMLCCVYIHACMYNIAYRSLSQSIYSIPAELETVVACTKSIYNINRDMYMKFQAKGINELC
jgi:hypothetical protein